MWLERREQWSGHAEDARGAGDVDYARVIHSASFRRLQGKTQILNLGDSDFYRTRLTHSLEVAQIAGGLARQLAQSFPDHPATAHLPDRSMIQAIGCSHDLGHPPFGHGGEVALNYCMHGAGGFEGNGQSLRILSRLESFSAQSGANLTRRSLLGLLKYPVPYSRAQNSALRPKLSDSPATLKLIDTEASTPPKCYLDSEQEVVDWVLAPLAPEERVAFCAIGTLETGKHRKALHKSFDCSIMDLADDIAYGVHDLEDAIALTLLTREDFMAHVPEEDIGDFLTMLKRKYPDQFGNDVYGQMLDGLFGDRNTRKRFISRFVNYFITAVEYTEVPEFAEPLLRYRATLPVARRPVLKALKDLVFDVVIKSPNVQQLEFKGQQMVVSVFEALCSDPGRLLPRDHQERFTETAGDLRVICDYVAAMTDAALLKTYERLFAPRMGSVFDRL
ncbi:anti-phage deoxyguanosine triphosphatase [Celeribacter persicus]|uniref:Deoxyguanosinetriphosphate triphosphohydrolase-like protein n=1 Tax=Celeribacter persicus TaxID=1651082 RepID=A0A2T5HS57_9RHOB|nr:anti-phage deoxyguanosine triphosphatase [Celeribacter persicus]PTQ74401.1 dGTPase [Celeribacter persicus]